MISNFLRLLIAYAALVLAPSVSIVAPTPADAQMFNQRTGWKVPQLYRATCSSNTVDATTFNFNGITTGVEDAASVIVVAAIGSEDSALSFSISSATIEGSAAQIMRGPNGATWISFGGLVAADFVVTTAPIRNAASVDVSVTFTEQVTSAVACVWVIANTSVMVPMTFTQNAALSGALFNIDIGPFPSHYPSVALGFCISPSNVTHTWTGLTERADTAAGTEIQWSTADALLSSETALSVTCDSASVAAGAIVAGITLSYGLPRNEISWTMGSNVANTLTGDATSANSMVCLGDAASLTTYTFSNITMPGISASDSVLIVVGVVLEDDATTFGVASATVDGAAATEIVDEDGTGLVNAAIYTSNGFITNADLVTVTVTASEAVIAGDVCVWAIKGLRSATPTSSVQDDDTASGALVLTLGTTTAGGLAVAVCTSATLADRATFAVLTRVFNGGHTDNGIGAATGYTTGSSMSVTCDFSGADDASGAAAAFR